MIAVIADDITGAAEMAGIAHRLGLRVSLTTEPSSPADCDVLVIATDTRSMTAEEAAAESLAIGKEVATRRDVEHIFKKTDSALRGHVIVELEALMQATGIGKAIYLPANPSKGRTIKNGVYYIDGTPLHETAFSYDPEFPAFSSSLTERFPDARDVGIEFADAESEDDVQRTVANASENVLLAGAADLFTAFLRRHCKCAPIMERKPEVDFSDCLIICGSTQSKEIGHGIPACYMPLEVYDGDRKAADEWSRRLAKEFADTHALTIAMQHRHRTGREAAVYLRGIMADAVRSIIGAHTPRELIIEGGATAFAIIRKSGWKSFEITEEIAPGVIRMRTPEGVAITMKPGSYPWGSLFAN